MERRAQQAKITDLLWDVDRQARELTGSVGACMEGEGKMIRWTRPEGGQGQVRKRVCAWRTWFRVRSTPGPCPASPSFSLPTHRAA